MAETLNTRSEVVRLTVRPQFLFVRGGHAERRKSLVVQARQRRAIDEEPPTIGAGFTATKKIGNAVIRNRSKRRLKEASRLLLPQHGVHGVDYVFIARLDTADIGWQRLLDDMESALISLAATLKRGSGEGPGPIPLSEDHGPST
ncbi:ribonuclease P protein component [Henriciella sp. AS95]|uniref:ribonuclease P protein component n=1 Tax=Henriciella sp. AS95 TaxID=3135782 RepID=UPI003182B1C1